MQKERNGPSRAAVRALASAAAFASLGLAGCGGGSAGGTAAAEKTAQAQAMQRPQGGTTQADAVRLANQATFGPTEALVTQIRGQGAASWVSAQMKLGGSRYASGGSDIVNRNMTGVSYCATPAQKSNPNCWRDYYSAEPLVWDFFKNATTGADQLRQRTALALQQMLVVSAVDVDGTYGFRVYQNMLLDRAFGNYRDLLRDVIKSPLMGGYLNHVNNDPVAPNENFGRELLQLFTIGPCRLNPDGTLAGGACRPNYDNDTVRNYAYALTGWTYPAGGSATWTCKPVGSNCPYYGGPMVAVPAFRDPNARKLLSGVTVAAGSSAGNAVEAVLDSLMAHPNIGPFVAKRLIQHFGASNPRPPYVRRVADAFESGSFTSDGVTFGKGQKGDLAATVAAVLLDPVARSETTRRDRGFLREPVLLFTGAIRALNGASDGGPLGSYWGEILRQHLFRSPTVFNYFPPDYPVAGTQRVGPEFGIHNANGALARLNFLNYLYDGGGSPPDRTMPGAIGTYVRTQAFESSAADAGALVDRLATLVLGHVLPAATRQPVVDAVAFWTDRNADDWRTRRVTTAAYLVLGSPDYQVQR